MSTQAFPLRVLMLSWRDMDNPEAGGAELYAEECARVLTERGDHVTIHTSRPPGLRREDHHGSVRILRRGGRLGCYAAGMLHVATHPRSYDVIVDIQNGLPFWSRLVTRTPVVVLVHHVHRRQWAVVFPRLVASLGWFVESRIAPWVYRQCRYLTVSMASRRELIDIGVDPERIDVVFPGNSEPVPPVGGAQARSATPRLTVLGRLVPHKNVERAIDTLAQLRSSHPDATLDVVGAGYWMPQLRDHAARRGVSEAVRFHGFVDETTKHRLLDESWVLLMPSDKEGWGLTIVEAGMHETPAVAFRHAGGTCESIVHGHSGGLATTLENFVDDVRLLVERQELRDALGERAARHAHQFNWQNSGDGLRTSILSVLGRGQRPPAPAEPRVDERSLREIVAAAEAPTGAIDRRAV